MYSKTKIRHIVFNGLICFCLCSGVEHGDEIYSLCQLSPVVSKPAVQDEPSSLPPSPQQQPAVVVKRQSSTEKVFKPKCLVDSATFLLPAGNGPVYLDVNSDGKPRTAPQPATSTASVIKKKPEPCSESPKAATAKIFAPRTEDMNKGFLTFSDDDTGLTSEFYTRIAGFCFNITLKPLNIIGHFRGVRLLWSFRCVYIILLKRFVPMKSIRFTQ